MEENFEKLGDWFVYMNNLFEKDFLGVAEMKNKREINEILQDNDIDSIN